MSAAEKLIRYCKVDTQSDPKSGTHPSSSKEFALAEILVEELKELGLKDAACDDKCYVYAHLESNLDHEAPAVGFIAHMDTAPDFTGTGVNPRIIENYDGGDIALNEEIVTRVALFPQMKKLKGKTLLVTDGNTLLGADDKAGIACIMQALEEWQKNPSLKHGRICVAFTPDEEIGEGPEYFDFEKMGADFAYTMDGDAVNIMSDETFNAASAVVHFRGFSIHPGEAKDRMINAGEIACRFAAALPEAMTPEHTEGKEGFIHLCSMHGNVESAELEYILRDHDAKKIQDKKDLMQKVGDLFNAEYGAGTAEISFADQYRNMKEVLAKHPEVSEIAWKSIQDLGLVPENVPIRGGTDGAQLSFHGLPCPNLGNGGGNFHGRYEYCVLEELDLAAKLVQRIAERAAGKE